MTLPALARPRATPRAGLTVLCLAALAALAACDDPVGTGTPLNFAVVEAGAHHSCGVLPGGAVFCWGAGELGQLGDAELSDSGWPVRVGGPAMYTELALGERHSCGLTVEGDIACWGWNRYGQLGTGTNNTLGAPSWTARGEHLYSSVSAGLYHTCALTTAAEAYCWGYNALGQLGDGTHQDSRLPVRVGAELDLRFVDIAAGALHTCGLTTDGMAYCWGLNHLGQLGTSDRANVAVPTPVVDGGPYTQVTAGHSHSCALTGTGDARCWGSNTYGELGNRSTSAEFHPGSVQPTPVFQEVHGGLSFTDISAGRNVTCALDTRDRAFCWGSGFDGQLGSNELRNWSVPRLVVATRDMRFARLSVGGGRHVCATTTALAGYCWGTSDDGGLGPRTTFSSQPVRIIAGRDD